MWQVYFYFFRHFHGGSDGKVSAYNAGDPGSIPGSGRSPGERNGNQLQYSCLENPMDGGVWWATVHGVAKSWTLLSTFTSLHPVSHRGYNILHSHQKCAMFIISTHSLRHLLSLFCFDNSQSGKCEVTFHCGYHLHFLDD